MPKLRYDPYDDAEKLGKYVPLKTRNDGARLYNPKSKVQDAIEAATLARGDNPKTARGDRLLNDVRVLGEEQMYGNEKDSFRPSQESRDRVKAAMQDVSELADQYKRETRGKGMKSGGAVKAKGWGQARGARAAKVY